MGLFDYFKKRSEEKRKKREDERKKKVDAELKKLTPYQKEINSNKDLIRYLGPMRIWEPVEDELKSDSKINLYDKIIEIMVTLDDKLIENNIIKLINTVTVRSDIEKKYGSEIKSKIIEKKAWIGMTEPMFKLSLMLLSGAGHLFCDYIIEDETKADGIYKYYKFNPLIMIPSLKKHFLDDKKEFIKEIKFKNNKLYAMEDLNTWSKKMV